MIAQPLTPRQRLIGACVVLGTLLTGATWFALFVYANRRVDGSVVEQFAAVLASPHTPHGTCILGDGVRQTPVVRPDGTFICLIPSVWRVVRHGASAADTNPNSILMPRVNCPADGPAVCKPGGVK